MGIAYIFSEEFVQVNINQSCLSTSHHSPRWDQVERNLEFSLNSCACMVYHRFLKPNQNQLSSLDIDHSLNQPLRCQASDHYGWRLSSSSLSVLPLIRKQSNAFRRSMVGIYTPIRVGLYPPVAPWLWRKLLLSPQRIL